VGEIDINVTSAGGGGPATAGGGEASVARYGQVEEAGGGSERVVCQEVSAGVQVWEVSSGTSM
jgi:hypothetical protein